MRLIVKSLLTEDPAKARRLLDGVLADFAFGPLRLAAEAALPGEPAEVVGRLSRASAAQRAFALDQLGGSASGSPLLARLLDAERGGPGTLFTFLSKQATSFPAADVRNACFNLLPEVPDRVALFEKSFGKLTEADKARIFALAAEAKPDWARAETQWRAAAAQFADDGSHERKLSAGIIYRHLATLSLKEPEIAGEDMFTAPVVSYLRKSLDCDPDHLPAVLQLIKLYREEGDDKDWHALAEEAAQRFPTDRVGRRPQGVQESGRVREEASGRRSHQPAGAPAHDRAADLARPQADAIETPRPRLEGASRRRRVGTRRHAERRPADQPGPCRLARRNGPAGGGATSRRGGFGRRRSGRLVPRRPAGCADVAATAAAGGACRR